MLRIHAIPLSTNVARVGYGGRREGVPYELVEHDPADRSTVRDLSGQDLVPVVEMDGEVLADSPVILRTIEARHPDPPLWPADPARRAEADVFVDWFNLVWKGPPNEIEALLEAPAPDRARIDGLAAQLRASRERFDALLDGRDFLLGDSLGIADVVAHPFLRYARGASADDPYLFHRILAEHLAPAPPRVEAWIERVDHAVGLSG